MLLALPGIPCLCPYLRILTLGMLMTTELDLDTQVIEMCEWPPFCQNAIDFFTLVCLLPNSSEAMDSWDPSSAGRCSEQGSAARLWLLCGSAAPGDGFQASSTTESCFLILSLPQLVSRQTLWWVSLKQCCCV